MVKIGSSSCNLLKLPVYTVSVYSTWDIYITLLLYWNQPYSYEMIYYPPSSPVIPILNWKWLEFTVTLTQLHFQSGTWQIFPVVYMHCTALEPVCCKKQQNKFLTNYWFVELEISEGSEWYKIDSGWSEESLGLIYNQFGIIQILQTSQVPYSVNK